MQLRLFSLPNLLTCANLLTGCVAIWLAFRGELPTACYLVALAAGFDFLDGLVARALRQYSPIGKELDSLADMISFGALPGVLLLKLLERTTLAATWPWIPLAGFLFTMFAALRLAKFNVDTRQTTSFIGVPTPAATLFVAALPLIVEAATQASPGLGARLAAPWLHEGAVLLAVTAGLSVLMISEIPLFALKFSSLRPEGVNRFRFGLVAAAVGLIGVLGAAGVPLTILLYMGLSRSPSTRR